MSDANKRQVGGKHYQKNGGEQHWDRQWRLYGPGYFVGCITKYVERYRDKNGIEDLEKAKHFLEKLIELETQALAEKEESKLGIWHYREPNGLVTCGADYANMTCTSVGTNVTCQLCIEKIVKREPNLKEKV